MQPTSLAAMSGGWPSQVGKRAGWCGPETEQGEGDYTACRFPPAERVALTAWGPQAPEKLYGKKRP